MTYFKGVLQNHEFFFLLFLLMLSLAIREATWLVAQKSCTCFKSLYYFFCFINLSLGTQENTLQNIKIYIENIYKIVIHVWKLSMREKITLNFFVYYLMFGARMSSAVGMCWSHMFVSRYVVMHWVFLSASFLTGQIFMSI